jgi:hypothetical protein
VIEEVDLRPGASGSGTDDAGASGSKAGKRSSSRKVTKGKKG